MIKMFNQSTRLPNLTKTKGLILASMITGAMALPLFMPAHKTQAENDDSDRGGNSEPLLGTWVVQVSLDPATVPPGALLNFTALATYGASGGFVESNSGPAAGGPPGQGNWVRTGHHRFATTQLRLGFDSSNNFTEINQIRSVLTLNKKGDEFTAIDQVDIILANGTVLPFHPAAIEHGTRVAIERLK